MGFNYDYKPSAKESKMQKGDKKKYGLEGTSMDKNKMLIIALVVFVAILFIGVSASMTGYATYRESINKQLEYTVQELADATTEKEQCNNNLFSALEKENQCKSELSAKDSQLNTCHEQKSLLEVEKSNFDATYNACLSEKNKIVADYESASQQLEMYASQYDALARSSARSVCCSIGDILTSAVKHWDVTDNKIVCSDNGRTINCGTGETDF